MNIKTNENHDKTRKSNTEGYQRKKKQCDRDEQCGDSFSNYKNVFRYSQEFLRRRSLPSPPLFVCFVFICAVFQAKVSHKIVFHHYTFPHIFSSAFQIQTLRYVIYFTMT